jgi:hypothetical protein
VPLQSSALLKISRSPPCYEQLNLLYISEED